MEGRADLSEQVAKGRQAAYDAVYEVIRSYPADAADNARVWRCVHAALNALAGTLIAAESSRRDWAAEAEAATAILADLVDEDPCAWDHNHSCQAHGFFYLDQGELCPHEEAKRLLAARLPKDASKVCSCISDDQATHLGPGFSRPVCAVHPTEESA